jgi:hypothetical protein
MKAFLSTFFLVLPFVLNGQFYALIHSKPKLDPDFRAVINEAIAQGYGLPSLRHQSLMNDIVVGLKNDGIWSELDYFAIYAHDGAEEFGWINWIDPTGPKASVVGSPVYTSANGYEETNSADYVDLNWATTDGTNVSNSSVTFGVYVDHRATLGFSNLAGAVDGAGRGTAIQVRNSNTERVSANTNLSAIEVGNTARGEGTWVVTQEFGDLEFFINGSLEHDFGGGGNFPNLSDDIIVGATRINGSPSGNNGTDFFMKAVFVGGDISNSQVSDLNTTLDAYFSNI